MTGQQILALGPALSRYLDEFADCFVSFDTRCHLKEYVCAQLSNLPRKSVEPIRRFGSWRRGSGGWRVQSPGCTLTRICEQRGQRPRLGNAALSRARLEVAGRGEAAAVEILVVMATMLAHWPLEERMSDRVAVILDTDIGSDIDDAVALSYLLRQPRCELAGITTVTGDVGQRAACCQVICEAAGRRDIPIHAGVSRSLLTGPGQPLVPQYQIIRDLPHRTGWPKNAAVEFLRQTIRSRPGEITLLSIGPLTNIALLFAMDPEIPSLLRGFVSMAGVFFDPQWKREWNIRVDPVAAAMVYAAKVPGHVSIGLDVTLKCTMDAPAVRERFVAPPLPVVLKLAEVWYIHQKHICFHDPLAAVSIFHPEICTYARGLVSVPITDGPDTEGRTPFTRCSEPTARHAPHVVAETVDPAAFFERYFEVFG